MTGRTFTIVSTIITALLVIAGCKDSAIESGVVSGKVTAINPRTKKKLPIQTGTITFIHLKSQERVTGVISEGNYFVSGVTPGPNKVTVVTTPPIENEINPDNPTGKQKQQTRWFPIREHYGDEESTPLSADVKTGKQQLGFELK